MNKINKNGTLIIAGFPGTGKSYYTTHSINEGLKVSDSDSSDYSWYRDGDYNLVRNPDFPNNYISHIKKCIDDKYDIVFVSTHKEVIKALIENEIYFSIIMPVGVYNNNYTTVFKKEYLERYKQRGSTEEFINMMDDRFVDFCKDLIDVDSEYLVTRIGLSTNFISNKVISHIKMVSFPAILDKFTKRSI